MNQVSNSPLTLTNSVKVFSAQLHTFTHHSSVLGCEMRFHLFVPAAPASGAKVPLLTWLSGLTVTRGARFARILRPISRCCFFFRFA